MQLVSGQVTLKTYNLLAKSHVVSTRAREPARYSRYNAYREISLLDKTIRSRKRATQTDSH